MSYILDALKKSDQERQQNNGPNLQSVHRQQPLLKPVSSKLWLLVVFLLVIIFVTGGWLFLSLSQPPLMAAKLSEAKQAKGSAPQPVSQTPEQSLAPTEVVHNTGLPIVELWELPDPVRQQIPPMTFSFHVYSENPARRTIIINKQRVREGSTVSAGLVLEEITPQGVVFNWQKTHRFAINVVENW